MAFANTIHTSAIIVSWNTRELLRACLQGLFEQQRVSLTVFVVDNNSSDGTQDMIRAEFPRVIFIANTHNAGFAAANNQALNKALDEFLILVNPDIEFNDPLTIHKLLSVQQFHHAGIAGPKLINSNMSLQQSVRSDPTFFTQFLILLKLHLLFPWAGIFKKYYRSNFDYKKTQTVDQISGAFFSISRECFNAVGLLDESFFIWFEEVDYCLRARKKQQKILYVADTQVIHHGAQSFQKVVPASRQKMYNKSLKLFAKKYYARWQRIALHLATWVSYVLASLTPKKVKPSFYRSTQ